jgi:Na+/H+-dicarboxylate symporter
MNTATVMSELFMRFLKLVSLPVISLSLMATVSGMGNVEKIKTLTGRILTYTFITTVLSAGVALCLFHIFDPKISCAHDVHTLSPSISYTAELLKIVPSNILQPFVEHNVIGVMFIALMLSFAIIFLPDEKRLVIHSFLDALYSAIMVIIRGIIKTMPFAVFAFVAIFVNDIIHGLSIGAMGVYLGVVVGANIIQACIVLPLLLIFKKHNPWHILKGMWPALSFAFFSKSSAASLPIAIECAENKLNITPDIARFSFPLCTTVNMNSCAAFILITVLFVSESHGMTFTGIEKISWVGIATLSAIGNAGVPMGCFFLASALLTTLGVPLTLMGVILPFYALIDMLESAINIWSDSCVTVIINKK